MWTKTNCCIKRYLYKIKLFADEDIINDILIICLYLQDWNNNQFKSCTSVAVFPQYFKDRDFNLTPYTGYLPVRISFYTWHVVTLLQAKWLHLIWEKQAHISQATASEWGGRGAPGGSTTMQFVQANTACTAELLVLCRTPASPALLPSAHLIIKYMICLSR